MIQIFDTDAILFGILKNAGLEISGDVYTRQRPDNSEKEDIVVGTIALNQDNSPQYGTSNINIHVPDLLVNIGGTQQRVADLNRLKSLSDIVLNVMRNANYYGLLFEFEMQTLIQEAEIYQHYSNLRLTWNIHI